jgi:hypothetical protein
MVMVGDMEKDPLFDKWQRRIIADSCYTIDVFGGLVGASGTSLEAWPSGGGGLRRRLLLGRVRESPDFLHWLDQRLDRKRGHPPRKKTWAAAASDAARLRARSP